MNVKRPQTTQGGTLVTVLASTGVLSILLFSSLHLASNANLTTARSLTWNSALPVAEAGIQEATAALQTCGLAPLSSVLPTNGWTLANQSLTKTRSWPDAYYEALVTATNTAESIGPKNPPIVYSKGFVAAPPPSRDFISRTVKVTMKAKIPPLFVLLARESLSLGGAAPIIDSFDSSNPSYSTGGGYDSAKRRAEAKIGCNSQVPGCINIRSTAVSGSVHTSMNGSASLNGTATVGDSAFAGSHANRGTIQAGHAFDDLDEIFPDVKVPFTSGKTMQPQFIQGTNYNYVAESGNYLYDGNLSIGSGQRLLVRGNATLYVTGSLTVGSSGEIRIAPTGSLRIVVGGPDCTLGGRGVVNQSGRAAHCTIETLPSCTSGVSAGTVSFVGTIYSPQGAWTLTGTADFTGAATARSIVVSGTTGIHYDESLATIVGSLYEIASWEEK